MKGPINNYGKGGGGATKQKWGEGAKCFEVVLMWGT